MVNYRVTRALAAFYWPGGRAGPAPLARNGVPVNERRPAAPRWVLAPDRVVRGGGGRRALRGGSEGCEEIRKVAKDARDFSGTQWHARSCGGMQ